MSSMIVYPEYCSTTHCARCSNSLRSASVHQLRKLPCASNWLPSSSNAWVSSWPIGAPVSPYFGAASDNALNRGGCHTLEGNLIFFFFCSQAPLMAGGVEPNSIALTHFATLDGFRR